MKPTIRKKSDTKQEIREKNFNIYLNGANADRVNDQIKRERSEASKARSQSRETRKGWNTSKKNNNESHANTKRQFDNDEQNEDTKPSERLNKWNKKAENKFKIKTDNSVSSNDSQSIEDETEQNNDLKSPCNNNNDNDKDDLDEMKNLIKTMNHEDIEKLKKSLIKPMNHDKIINNDNDDIIDNSIYQDSLEINNIKTQIKKQNKNNQEIEEDITHEEEDIHPKLPLYNPYPTSSSASRAKIVVKARPISATYNQNSISLTKNTDNMAQSPSGPYVSQQIKFDPTNYIDQGSYNFSSNTPSYKKVNTNPFKRQSSQQYPIGEINSTTNTTNIKPIENQPHFIDESATEIKNNTKISTTPAPIIQPKETYAEKLLNSSNYPDQKTSKGKDSNSTKKGYAGLLQRIENLDESKKEQLEKILDKIEKGELDVQVLLQLDYLNSNKKSGKSNSSVESSSDVEKIKKPSEISQAQKVGNNNTNNTAYLSQSKTTKSTLKSEDTSNIKFENNDSLLITNEPGTIIPRKENLGLDPNPKKGLIFENQTKEDDIKPVLPQSKQSIPITIGVKMDTIPTGPLKPEVIQVNKQPIKQQIILRIISTWGNIAMAGLTELQIFNEDGQKIEIKPQDFHIKNCGYHALKSISNLVDNIVYTTDEAHMWYCNMLPPPATPEICLTFFSEKPLGALRIWNYNKSMIESTKGIKELEIVLNDKVAWTGIVKRGSGNEYEEYLTEIMLNPNTKLPTQKAPPKPNESINASAIKTHPQENNMELEEAKKEALSKERPISVPIWLADTKPNISSYPSRGSIQNITVKELLAQNHIFSQNKTVYDSSFALNKPEEEKSFAQPIITKTIESAREKADIGMNKSRILNEKTIIEQEMKPRSAKMKHHPRISSPLSNIFAENSSKSGANDKKKDDLSKGSSVKVQSDENDIKDRIKNGNENKRDDNASINSLEYFNITNFGRIRPAKRESLIQIISLQNFVQDQLKNVEKNLELHEENRRLDLESQQKRRTEHSKSRFKTLDTSGSIPKNLQNIKPSSENIITTQKKSQKPSGSDDPKDSLDTYVNVNNQIKNSSSSKQFSPKRSTKTQLDDQKVFGYDDYKSLIIPELPKGRCLAIIIYSTWGDQYYTGLSGIEIFDDKGEQIQLSNIANQVKADPPDINILPGYGKDPRTIDKLFDGINMTCDDLHVWLAPFTKGKENYIWINFESVKIISMIRIWNYNKSRIHSYRGAKDIGIKLDNKWIFKGEISKAPGSLQGCENCAEYIMFTQNEKILSAIEKDDWLNKILTNEFEPNQNTLNIERPKTGTRRFDENEIKELNEYLNTNKKSNMGIDGRPLTSAVRLDQEKKVFNNTKVEIEKNKKILEKMDKDQKYNLAKEQAQIEQIMKQMNSLGISISASDFKFKKLTISLLKSWGDDFYIGLTGFELYDLEGNKISLHINNINARPRDMNAIPGHSGDSRTLDKLIDGVNATTNEADMWMIPFVKNQNHQIFISFPEPKSISAIKIWNYNKNHEDSCRGVKLLTIQADGVFLTPSSGILIRKAPGIDKFDFGQLIQLPFTDGWDEEKASLYKQLGQSDTDIIQEYDTCEYPTGFEIKIAISSNWGDPCYVGLNGLEIYDHKGDPLCSRNDARVFAEPPSVNILPGLENDIRTPDKLINGINNTYDDRNIWLSPLISRPQYDGKYNVDLNTIYIVFDKPIIISCINMWNYTKTPTRGVKEIQIFCDDLIIYRGNIRIAPTEEKFREGNDIHTSILFTKDNQLIQKLYPSLYNQDGYQQVVQLVNEKKIVSPGNQQDDFSKHSISLERPTTSVKGLIK